MRNEIYEIGDQPSIDSHRSNVPGGGATSDEQQPRRSMSPAASFSDDHSHGETHPEPVVRSGAATIGREKPKYLVSPAAKFSDDHQASVTQRERVVRSGGTTTDREKPTTILSPAATNSDDRRECATQSEPVVRRGRGQVRHDTQAEPASSSKNYKGRPAALVGEADQVPFDTQTSAVGFPAIKTIPGDHSPTETQGMDVAGGEASQAADESHRELAGLSNLTPGDRAIRGTQSSTVAGGGEAGHLDDDTHERGAGLSKLIPDDHSPSETHSINVAGGEASHATADNHEGFAGLSAIIEEIREQWRRRQVWHRSEKSLTLQAKACCRRLVEGDKIRANALFKSAYDKCDNELAEVAFAATFPLVEAGKSVELHRKAVEKRLLKLAAQLPIAEFILGLRGVGLLSLAGIIGEAGDLSAYSNPAKLWKRMGMGLVDGGRQRRVTDKEAALKHGYSPSRRSHMWNIGSCIIKAGGPLKDLYAERKEYELTKPETASKLHAHRKAQRYVEKRLLRDMWCEWRKH